MSARASNWAWQQTTKTVTQKLVLVALADRADEDGECFPSATWIAAKCGPTTTRSVRNAIADLEEQGFVEKTQRRRRSDGTLGTWLLRLRIDVTSYPTGSVEPVTPQGKSDLDLLTHTTTSTDVEVADTDRRPRLREQISAQILVGEFVDQTRAKGNDPPRRVVGQVAKYVGELVAEGQPPDKIRAGLRRMAERRVIVPSLLGNFVLEAGLPPPKRAGPGITADELWENGINLEDLNGNR